MTVSVWFETSGVGHWKDSPVNITFSYPGYTVTYTELIESDRIDFDDFITPSLACDVTYTIDAAGQDSATGTFHVYGPPCNITLTTVGSPVVTTDGTLLVMANGVSTQKFLVTMKDIFGNIVAYDGVHITMTVGGSTTSLPYFYDAMGRAVVTLGPSSSRTDVIYVDAWLDWTASQTKKLKFIDGHLTISTDKTKVNIAESVNNTINVTVTLMDGPDPLPGVNVSVKCVWPNSTVDTVNSKSYTTPGSGIIAINNKFTAGLFNSLNTMNVFIAQIPGLGLLDVSMVRGYTSNAANLYVYVLPNDPDSDGTSYYSVNADGVHGYTLIAHVTDEHDNDAEEVPVVFDTYANLDNRGNFIDEITNTYSADTSTLGIVSAVTEPMISPGKIKVNVSTGNLSRTIILYYMSGPPTRLNIQAYPDVIASSDVFNENITYPINTTQLVAYVTDEWGHPIMGQPVNLTVITQVNGWPAGTIQPTAGITDINGQFASQFALDPVNCTGYGTVQVRAASGNLTGNVTIEYTENSHLNITTSVDKSRVAVNGTVNVTVRIDGVGWQEGRNPADVIFVMDRSGSMGDAVGYTNYGASAGGWFAPDITTYTNLPKNTTTNITYYHDKVTRMIFKVWQQPPALVYPPANAEVVSEDIPTEMMAGTWQDVHITMRNLGQIQWDEYNSTYGNNDYVRLLCRGGGSWLDKDMTITPTNFVVYPGDTYTFTYRITAPNVAVNTTYHPYYQMYQYYTITWFGEKLTHDILVYPNPIPTPTPTATPTPVPTPYATLLSDNFPTAIKSGETKTVTVTMKNTGDASFPWPISTSQYSLGLGSNNWRYGISNNYYVKDFAASDVNKDDLVSFTFTMTGPTGVFVNTTYPITFQMKKDASGFGSSYTRNVVVYNDTIPLASALYGDWYYYSLMYNNASFSSGWATTESPAVNTTGSVMYPTADYKPTFGSSGPPGACAAAPIGTYTIKTTRYYKYGAEVPFKIYVWDDMKMGQKYDADAAAKRSAKAFIDYNLINRYDRAGLVTFSDAASLDSGLSMLNQGTIANKTYLKNNISQINSWGNTNIYDGLRVAHDEFESNPPPRSDQSKVVILLTDGYSTSDVNTDLAMAQSLADDDVKVYTIGIGSSPSQINVSELTQIADITGGFYQFVNPDDILAAYNNIGRAMEQNITTNSTLHLMGERTNIGGVWSNNTTYVPGSAYIMIDNDTSTLHQAPPTITFDGTDYVLSWDVTPIRVSGTWVLNYTIRANLNGPTYPIANGSQGIFVTYGNTSNTFVQNVQSPMVYVGSGGNMTPADIMNIDITLPTQMYSISQPYQVIAWDLSYNASGLYSQVVEYAPYGTNDFRPIASGFEGNASSSFSTVWDIARMNVGRGTYTIRITATDGQFMTVATREVVVDYLAGLITIGQPDDRVLPGY